ncbi:hypothetical protein Ancab_000608 [Ancistrocladus abbreviatus]
MADHRPQEGDPCLHTNANTARNNGVSCIPAIASTMYDHQPPQRPHYSLINVNFGELLIIGNEVIDRFGPLNLSEFPSHMYRALNSGDHTGLAIASLSNNRHAPLASSVYTSNHTTMATSYLSDDHAAMADSYSGNQTAVMASYPSNNRHAETAESSYFVNRMVVGTSYPSNHIAVSTSFTSNNHHDTLLNSSYSDYNYHAGDCNMMTVAFSGQDINACTNLPSTSSGFTQGLLPLPPPQFFWTEQPLTFTAQDKSMIGCNSGSDLLWQAIRDNLARCNSLHEYFRVAHSTLDHTGRDRITNTVPVHQSVNDPHCMIPHKNDLEHPVENGGSDCGTIVGLGMEVGGRSQNGGMLPIENPMYTELQSYMKSVNFASTPRVDDGDLIMTPMQASGRGGGRPGAYYPSAQFGVGNSDQSRGVGGNLSGVQPI